MTEIAASTTELGARCELRIGSTFLKGKYRLDALLGVGGMAAVYAATHRNGDRVALKVLHTELSIDDDIRRRFLREGYVANRVEHRGAVRVIDDDIAEDGTIFLVLELLEGETLARRCARRRHPLAPREVLTLTNQLLDVLIAAHDKGIVHRDLKPENLFLTLDGVLKVLDFGIARVRDAGHPAATMRTGRMLGTPDFMPPEQALGRSEAIDARTDLWAVGATMFSLLSSQPVHDGATPEETLVFAATRPARSLAEVAPELPAPIVALVDKALQFVKSDRFRDARAMSVALEEANNAVFHVRLPPLPVSSGFSRPTHDPALADTTHAKYTELMRDASSEPPFSAPSSSPPKKMGSRHMWKQVPGSLPPVSTAVSPSSRHPAPHARRRYDGPWALALSGLAGMALVGGALLVRGQFEDGRSERAFGGTAAAHPAAPAYAIDASAIDARSPDAR